MKLTEEQRKIIEHAIVEGAKAYANKGRITIPAPVVLAVARKP